VRRQESQQGSPSPSRRTYRRNRGPSPWDVSSATVGDKLGNFADTYSCLSFQLRMGLLTRVRIVGWGSPVCLNKHTSESVPFCTNALFSRRSCAQACWFVRVSHQLVESVPDKRIIKGRPFQAGLIVGINAYRKGAPSWMTQSILGCQGHLLMGSGFLSVYEQRESVSFRRPQ